MANIRYDDLKLGEVAKEAFEQGEPIEYITKKYPVYLNTRQFYKNLNVTDAVIAAVLGKLNILLVGDTGTGKTQLAKDIFNYYFGGNKSEGGHGIMVRGYRLIDYTLYDEVFTELRIEKARRELTENIEALISLGDEINRAPTIRQNEFLELGDGVLNYKGKAISVGKRLDSGRNYHVLIATANLGNSEFGGTFDMDKALYNRLHIVLDLDYEGFKSTIEDEILIDRVREADPKVKESPKRDISEKILKASEEIAEKTRNPGLEALGAINYLRFGLDYCEKNDGRKGKAWPLNCQDCGHNKNNNALCALIRAPVRRTLESTLKYAAALHYVAKLKDSKVEIDSADLIFKAFELTGAYQLLLNPYVLRQEYYEENPKMMSRVVEMLRDEYKKNEDFILTSLERAREKGEKRTTFFKAKDPRTGKEEFGFYDDLSEELKKQLKKIEPFKGEFEWVKKVIDVELKHNCMNKDKKTKGEIQGDVNAV